MPEFVMMELVITMAAFTSQRPKPSLSGTGSWQNG
jgi:hypothetical protein